MKRMGAVKFPNSVQLFKFCQKVFSHQKGSKIRDQEIGNILGFNPSDCSHWKRGEKNVRSVFALAKLAEAMQVETSLVHDVASGAASLDEAFFEYLEAKTFKEAFTKSKQLTAPEIAQIKERIQQFVGGILQQSEFSTPPLYLPEVLRFFSFVTSQPIEMIDKLSRILRIKPGQYAIHYKKGDLKPQTRMSIVKDLARILFQGERARFPELGAASSDLLEFEEIIFTANLLAPKAMLLAEMAKLDARKNVVSELATLFWVPKSLVCLQLQDIVRNTVKTTEAQAGMQINPINLAKTI